MSEKIDPLAVQFGLIHDCVRACVFGDYIMRRRDKLDAWWSIADMCYSDAVLSWNGIFGVDSQESHWKNFTKQESIPINSKLNPFSADLLLRHLGMSCSEWSSYWKTMTQVRNKRLAHFDHRVSMSDYPNVTKALHSACFYRLWLKSLVEEKNKFGEGVAFDGPTNDEMINLFRSQIEAVCS